MQHFSLKIRKLKKKLSLCDSGIWRAAWLEDNGFFFVSFKFQPKSTFTLKSYKVWKLTPLFLSAVVAISHVLESFSFLNLKANIWNWNVPHSVLHFTPLVPQNPIQKLWADMIAPSSLVLPLFTFSSACFHLLFVQLAYCSLMAKPGGFLLIVALKSVYADKRKKISHKHDVLWVVDIHWGKANTYQGEIWYTQTPDEADEE